MSNTIKQIVVVDIESTCWNTPTTKKNEVIELGVWTININGKTLGNGEGIIILPTTTEISPFCTELTTLTTEYVAEKGISFREGITHLSTKYKTKNSIWASWGDYDRKQIENQCRDERVGYPFGNMHINVKALFASQFGFSCGMDRALKHVNLPLEGTHHRGVDDAKNIAKILVQLLPLDD